jgi:hypothetical protein
MLYFAILAITSVCVMPVVAQVNISSHFDGAGATGWAPPDPNSAVGPNYIVQAVNNNILIFNKSGTFISQQPLNTFFGTATAGDPHVVYDEISKQFLFEVIGALNPNGTGTALFAASDTSDPTGNWHKMTINVSGFWDGYGGNGIGYNADAYVVHVNGFNNQFAVIPIRNNPGFTYNMWVAPSGFRIGRPVPMAGSSPGGPFYFVEGNGDGVNNTGGTAGNLEVVQVNNISGSPTIVDYQVHVNNTETSVVNTSWRNNQLAAIGTVGGSTSVQWYLLSTNGAPSLQQTGSFGSPDGGQVFDSSIAVAPAGDLGVNYVSVTGSGMTMYVAGRGALDSAGTMRASVAAAAAAKSNGRMGDYSSCVVDVDSSGVPQNTFWACGEYMNSTSEFDWKTRLTKFNMVNSSTALIGHTIALQSLANNLYVCADNNGNSPLIANRGTYGLWEEYNVIDAGNGHIALQSLSNNKYVCADNAGNSPLIANRTSYSSWEEYNVINAGGGHIALQSLSNNKYVCADNAGNSPLIANRTSYSTWEEYTAVIVR